MPKKRKVKELKELKEQKELTLKKRLMMVLYGSVFFFIISVLTFALIFYFAYLFDIIFLRVAFKIVLILIAFLVYYILLEEFIGKMYRKY